MRILDIITKKRNGKKLEKSELQFLISSYVKKEVPDYQVAAWLMAVYFQGMDNQECAWLTEIMLHSGKRLDFSSISGIKVDKHSTGGVGDKLSLIIAPLAASCGVKVPMMSGRALGHTGGTLDKLESIKGYSSALSEEQMRQFLQSNHYFMTGQSRDIAPADKLMYALRDVTATVESIPLITASILSKKLAEGSQALVFDVKCGKGAFMKDLDSARQLAHSLVETGAFLGSRIRAVISNMDQPLGFKIGNFLEVEESLDVLEGNGPADVRELSLFLSAQMLLLAGITKDTEQALQLCRQKLDSGEALSCFLKNIDQQGGSSNQLMKSRGKIRADFFIDIKAPQSGFISSLDAGKCGLASMYLGCGRDKKDDLVSPAAGIILECKKGDRVEEGTLLCRAYSDNESKLQIAIPFLEQAFQINDNAGKKEDLIFEVMSKA